MPITIDTSKDAQNIDNQLDQLTEKIAKKKQVDPKYFSQSMTGNGKRKNGLFGTSTDTINDFIKDNRRLLDTVMIDEAKEDNMVQFNENAFGNQFKQETKKKELHFRQFENNLTTIIPPIMLETVINDYLPVALSFPKQTAMYMLANLETSWSKLFSWSLNGEAVTTYVLPVVQSMRLHSKESVHVSSVSQIQSKKITVAGQPDIKILVATVHDDMIKDGQIAFVNQKIETKHGKNVTKREGIVSIYSLEEYSRNSYNYNKLEEDIHSHVYDVINTPASANIALPTTYQIELIVGDHSLSDLITSQASIITHQAEEIMLSFVRQFSKHVVSLTNKKTKFQLNDIEKSMNDSLIAYVQHIDVLNELEENIISTDLLAMIYETLSDTINDKKIVNSAARHSLRLLLSQRLHELDDIRNSGGLYKFEDDNPQAQKDMARNPDYSLQQKKIITSTDPLVIGQAGAGSGKSHTLIGRLNYLEENGEDLSKALVLSFTNVSAININQRFPGVRSETLANMFHSIYTASYPMQALSQPSTVSNSIRLLSPESSYFKNLGYTDEEELADYMNKFAINLEQFDQTGFKRVDLQYELKQLSNLIDSNLDLTSHLLNAVEQTTLELEPIIIHHRLLRDSNSLNIPQEYQDLDYIITDESQDISTFEYILLLELTIHYRSQLLIIGDGSQTLYEFRNSDPRYMNALEASNVFTSHKLETNYRSNEEILMYANQFLQVIDANKYANIQLQSASFTTPSVKSVKDMIKITSIESQGRSNKDYTDTLFSFAEEDKDFKDWLLDKVRKGEQVAFMGWTRKEVVGMGEIIEQILADNNLSHIEITNIMSNSQKPMIILSRFARMKNMTMRSLDPTNVNYNTEVRRHAVSFVNDSFKHASQSQKSFFEDVIMRTVRKVTQSPNWNAKLRDLRAAKPSDVASHKQAMGSHIIREMLREETRKNAMDQFLNKQKEIPDYDTCPIILSTIHGTKGLEFDHTVIMFNEGKNSATSQESLRMMFVALSRAKKSEFLINVHPTTPNRLVTDTHSAMLQTPIESAMMRTLNVAQDIEDGN